MGALLRKAVGTQLGPGQGCEWGVTRTLSTPSLQALPDSAVKPGQPQALGQEVGFSLGGSETELLTDTGVGQVAGPFYPAWLLLVDCLSWLGKSTAVLCPFGGDCK